MILIIDNYDSFTYNLYQAVGSLNPDIKIIRNDVYNCGQIQALNPERIIISPGPGRPKEAGVCIEVIKTVSSKIPILGICLGHQAIYEAFGGVVSYAKELMHGKSSQVDVDNDNPLFLGLPPVIQAARYHSLAGSEDTLPKELRVIARTSDGEIMAVCHQDYPVYGVQFHPESILTPLGTKIIENFFKVNL